MRAGVRVEYGGERDTVEERLFSVSREPNTGLKLTNVSRNQVLVT